MAMAFQILIKTKQKAESAYMEISKVLKSTKRSIGMLETLLEKTDQKVAVVDKKGKLLWPTNLENGSKSNFGAKPHLGDIIEMRAVGSTQKLQDAIAEVVEKDTPVEWISKVESEDRHPLWIKTKVYALNPEIGVAERFVIHQALMNESAKTIIKSNPNNAPEPVRKSVILTDRKGVVKSASQEGKQFLAFLKTDRDGKINRSGVLKKLASLQEDEVAHANFQLENRLYKLSMAQLERKDEIELTIEDITESNAGQLPTGAGQLIAPPKALNLASRSGYGHNLQRGLQHAYEGLRTAFDNSFHISIPKGMVSGDFLWFYEQDQGEKCIIALADSSFSNLSESMSSLAIRNQLNELAAKFQHANAADFLNLLNLEVLKKSLHDKVAASPHFALSILTIDRKDHTVSFAGTFQTGYWMNGKLNALKSSRIALGTDAGYNPKSYTTQTFKVAPGDSIYLLSDGFINQFGGPSNKKFLRKRLHELIVSNSADDMCDQSLAFLRAFENWKGNNEQVDDVSVLGIKF